MATKEDDNWTTIDVDTGAAPEKVEFEIEKDEKVTENVREHSTSKEDQQPYEKEATAQVINKEDQEDTEEPVEELKGVETKGAQKRIRQLIRQRKEREEEISKLRRENDNLRQSVSTKDQEISQTVRTTIDSTESQIEARISQAKQIYKSAAESGDTDKMLQAQEEMGKSYAEQVALREKKAAWERYTAESAQVAKRNTEAVQATQNVPQYDPKALDWASKNGWFGKDQVMTSAALAIDAELKADGYSPEDEEYYEEIDNRLRSQFPNKFKQVQQESSQEPVARLQDSTSNSAQVVSGASRTPKTSSSKGKKVKLTQEDVRLAQKWGIPLEQYAAEKLKADQADGDYTTVF